MAKILGCSVRMSSKLSADKCTTSPESPSQLPEHARRREQRERTAQAEQEVGGFLPGVEGGGRRDIVRVGQLAHVAHDRVCAAHT